MRFRVMDMDTSESDESLCSQTKQKMRWTPLDSVAPYLFLPCPLLLLPRLLLCPFCRLLLCSGGTEPRLAPLRPRPLDGCTVRPTNG
jgi:hypothetical protein